METPLYFFSTFLQSETLFVISVMPLWMVLYFQSGVCDFLQEKQILGRV